ncbi:hypothetical protein N7G274_006309 [Stereocaulon virgatum]|uniref:Chromatin modification-related protein EAF3 n=1 Tax=Stereocaulon virgatum TaxID=373712 RepID=A0ABR4A7G9_9LECA
MAPSNIPQYTKDEKVLCFHHELLYEAKVLDLKHMIEGDKKSPYQYRVHYKGWKSTWDDWVPQDRIRKNNEDNKILAANLKTEMERVQKPKAAAASARKKAAGSDLSSTRGSEERHATPVTGRGQKRGRDYEIEKEETFNLRPAVRIHVPDHLKALLVDDWENVTKNLSLVPLPSDHPVNEILNTYFDEEKHKRRLGSAEADLLEEVVAGCKDYFEKCIGRILLYRFERQQYAEVRKLWEEGRGEWEGKNAGDVYGAEHLCRLFVSLPELIAQTNMDSQSVNKLREEIQKLTSWLGKNSNRFFTAEYETASNDYAENNRGV